MDLLAKHAALTPTKIAVRMAEGETGLTYAQLDIAADALAKALRAAGLAEGETIALLLDNHCRVLECWWGARRAGLYYVPLGTKLTAPEIAYILSNCDARLVLTDNANSTFAREAASLVEKRDLDIVVIDPASGTLPLLPTIGTASGDQDAPPSVVGREMIYSSGTTGRPKGIKRALAPNAGMCDLPELELRMRALFEIDENVVYLSVSPLYHATGRFLNRVIETGGTAVILPRFDALAALAAIARHQVTTTQWVPTMFSRLLALPTEERMRHDLSSHRIALHAAAPCPLALKRRMIDWWGPIVHEYYGGTENAGVTFIRADEWLAHPGSVGRPISGGVRIVDEATGHEIPCGEIGLITFDGGVPFTYFGEDSDLGATSRVSATYGDLGWVDADGYLFISDRRNDLIISGGVNIYPKEIETILDRHPAVCEAAVIGVPDPEFGQRVMAVICLNPGVAAEPGALIAFCREQISAIKCPRVIAFVGALPRNENGKLLKRVLRDEFGR